MEITKIELKILIKEFLMASNRVLRAGFEIYASELSKFINFLEEHELIYEYVKSCGIPEYDVKAEVEEICNSYGRSIFSLGTTSENEVANIYAVIKYLAENNYSGRSYVFYGYSSSKKYQEKVNAFGDEFIRVLINHIENYLTRLSIQMGLDDKMSVNVKIENSTISNAQVNVAHSGSTITTAQNLCDSEQLQNLLENLIKTAETLNSEDKQMVSDCADAIVTLTEEKPKKGMARIALNTLKGITGTAEFAAAVASIVQFVQAFM